MGVHSISRSQKLECAVHSVQSSGNMAALYFVILNVVGNYMVLNMFLAILLARFEEPDDDDEGESGAKEGNSSAKVVLRANRQR